MLTSTYLCSDFYKGFRELRGIDKIYAESMEKVKNKIENPNSYKSSFLEKIAFNWHFLNKLSYLIRLRDIKNVERQSIDLSTMSDAQNTTSSPILEMSKVSTISTSKGIVNRDIRDNGRGVGQDSDDEDTL